MAEITLHSHNSKAIMLMTLVSLFLLFAVIAVFLRVRTRLRLNQRFYLNDYAIFLALFFVCLLSATSYISSIVGGLGVPTSQLTSSKYIHISKQSFKYGWLSWGLATSCVRISILDFLLKVFATDTFTRRGAYVLMCLNVMYIASLVIEFSAICRPFNRYWIEEVQGKCGDIQLGILVAAIVNLILDFLIIFLPMHAVWKLKMPLSKKFGVSVVFGMGAVICAISVARIFTLRKFSKPSAQSTWSISIIDDAILTSIEPSLGIINACLPLLASTLRDLANSRLWRRMEAMVLSVTPGTSSRRSTSDGWSAEATGWPTKLQSFQSLPGPKNELEAHYRNFSNTTTLLTSVVSQVPPPQSQDRIDCCGRASTESVRNLKMHIEVTREWDVSRASMRSEDGV